METTILLRCLGNLFHRLTLLRCGAPLLLGCPLQEDSRRNQNRGFPGGTPPIYWSAKWKISFTFKTFNNCGFLGDTPPIYWSAKLVLDSRPIWKMTFTFKTDEISMFCSYLTSLIKNSTLIWLSHVKWTRHICKWYICHTSHTTDLSRRLLFIDHSFVFFAC